MLKDSHYENPQSLLDECLIVLDLKDQDLCQKQRDIEALKKKVADLEVKLKEKDVQIKSIYSISVQTEEDKALATDASSATNAFSTTDDTVKSSTDRASAAPQKSKGKQNKQIPKKFSFKSSSVPKNSSSSTNISAQDYKYSTCPWFTEKRKLKKESKKKWVHKKAFSEPRKMKQIWVIKGTLAHSEVLITKELREMFWNQKSKEKKKRVQKFDNGGCSPTVQRYHQVSVSKPKFIWVPKTFN